MKEFTSEELVRFNGRDGNPVYVAYDGKVYDVSASRLWSKGAHMNRHAPGKNLSGEMSAAPHGPEVLERYPQVGLLKKGVPEEIKHLPTFLQHLLQQFPMVKRHPHPVVVHFPIAFLIASSLFLLLHFFFRKPSFETTSYYLLVLGTIASPFAIATGALTWWINYQLRLSRLIRRKIQLSAVLILLEAVLIAWRSFSPGEAFQTIHPFYLILGLCLTLLVFLLGYYGGQMTFPPEI